MTQFAVSALVERRREIMREKAYLEREIARCDEAMGHLDARWPGMRRAAPSQAHQHLEKLRAAWHANANMLRSSSETMT